MYLSARHFVLTGASAGIGAIYADRLARRGYDLILIARNRLNEVAKRIAGATGRTVKAVAADLSKKADLTTVEAMLGTEPGITMLVNNAGIGALEPVLQSAVNVMEEMIKLNVTALTRLTYAVVPALVSRRHHSQHQLRCRDRSRVLDGVYGGTKAFVLAFSLSLHKELTDKDTRIQVVLPGATATNFWDVAGGSVEQLPQQTVMKPEDMVDAALAGLDQNELVTIPSLANASDWHAFEVARQALVPNLSLNRIPARYVINVAA